jgi:hypothetical protein
MLAPRDVRFTHLSKDGDELDAFHRAVGCVLKGQRDAWDELVLAIGLDAGVVPTGLDVANLQNLLDLRVAGATRRDDCEQEKNGSPHADIRHQLMDNRVRRSQAPNEEARRRSSTRRPAPA